MIETSLREGMVAVDVGANIGVHTLAMARRAGATGRVYAIEPDPANFRALERAVEDAGLAQVRLHRAAAGAVEGTVPLHLARMNRGDHRLAPAGRSRRVIAVSQIVLDELLASEAGVDVLKIDVQGWEVEVLRGLRRTIARSAGVRVLCEVCPALLEAAGASRDAFFAVFRDAGLEAHRLERGRAPEPIAEREAWVLASERGFVNLLWQRPGGSGVS